MKSAKKSRVLAPKTSVQKAIAHRKIERKAAALTKLAEVAHQEYRAAKLVYKAAKKAAKKAAAPKAEKPPAPGKAGHSVEVAAYLNYRSRIEKGLPGDPIGDWLAAEKSPDV